MISGLIGSVPTTTYGENIGVMAITFVCTACAWIAGAAVLSIVCSFIGKFSTFISTIPGPVIGGISFLLYGMIGTSGLRIPGGFQGGLRKFQKSGPLPSVIFVTGPVGNCREVWKCAAYRYGAGLRGGHDFKSGIFMFWITLSYQ